VVVELTAVLTVLPPLLGAGAVVSVATPPPQHFWSTEINVVPPDVDAAALGCMSGGTKPAWLLCVSGAGTPPNSKKVCSMFLKVVGVRVGVVRVGTPQWRPPSSEFNTRFVMVGVSKTGTSVVVNFPSASSSVDTAVIVKLTLGITASSLLMVVTGTLDTGTLDNVNGRCSAALAAATPLDTAVTGADVVRAVVEPRVNIVMCVQGSDTIVRG